MVLPTARKPEGGFQFISIVHLYAVWCAYDSRRIHLHDVRLWYAAQEMVARRCQMAVGQHPVYRQDELQSLTGRRGGITTAIARLQTAGLLTWEITALIFPSPGIEPNTSLAQMLAQIPNHHRRVPVPRRLLRFLAKGCSRVLLATILGHLFRCLYYRQGQCRADGFCKASWIAEVFGVSPRAVKTARQRLEALGFLQRTETPQWVRNRYGQKMTINLQWDGKAMRKLETPEPRRKTAPLVALESPQIAPPDSDSELLTERKYQKSTSSGPTGVLSTLFAQARECLRNGSTFLEESAPVQETTATTVPNLHTITSAPKTASLLPPRLYHVVLPDLRDMERLLTLYAEAVQTCLIGPSEAERLAFVALAQHVLAFRPTNPGGLFLQLLRQRRFVFITQEEEDIARRRLSAYVYPDQPGAGLSAVA